MHVKNWIFSVSYVPKGTLGYFRRAVVGPASVSTVEAALQLVNVPEEVQAEIRLNPMVRQFIEGALSSEVSGHCATSSRFMVASQQTEVWLVCIGPVHEVLR